MNEREQKLMAAVCRMLPEEIEFESHDCENPLHQINPGVYWADGSGEVKETEMFYACRLVLKSFNSKQLRAIETMYMKSRQASLIMTSYYGFVILLDWPQIAEAICKVKGVML